MPAVPAHMDTFPAACVGSSEEAIMFSVPRKKGSALRIVLGLEPMFAVVFLFVLVLQLPKI